jgi:hypothetical protein
MTTIETLPELSFISELYAADLANSVDDVVLLAEYPSSNSGDTDFRNKTKYIIHDPFPPPRRELLKVLGPHHLMCGWGQSVACASEVPLPSMLMDHWQRLLGSESRPNWKSLDHSSNNKFITLFPHESLAAKRQIVDPDVSYAVHSKEVIEKIDCPQAEVLDSIQFPCIVKLSHGYAGLGNFLIENADDEAQMRKELSQHWPDAVLVVNSIIENIVGDYGVQFYLRRDGSMVWFGLTEQQFDANKKWCGGTFSAQLQIELCEALSEFIRPTGEYLHSVGYFGLVGIDILRDSSNQCFLVDVNPRLTGISPFLAASRIFARRDGFDEGVYQASFRFDGTMEQLIAKAESRDDAKVLVLSAFEDSGSDQKVSTVCHISVTSNSQQKNQSIIKEMSISS